MASTYSSDLKLELMATGENAGTWGTKTNTNLELSTTSNCRVPIYRCSIK
jgi:hypothetical protein